MSYTVGYAARMKDENACIKFVLKLARAKKTTPQSLIGGVFIVDNCQTACDSLAHDTGRRLRSLKRQGSKNLVFAKEP